MKKYIILDEEGYTWCVDKGIATDKFRKKLKREFLLFSFVTL